MGSTCCPRATFPVPSFSNCVAPFPATTFYPFWMNSAAKNVCISFGYETNLLDLVSLTALRYLPVQLRLRLLQLTPHSDRVNSDFVFRIEVPSQPLMRRREVESPCSHMVWDFSQGNNMERDNFVCTQMY